MIVPTEARKKFLRGVCANFEQICQHQHWVWLCSGWCVNRDGEVGGTLLALDPALASRAFVQCSLLQKHNHISEHLHKDYIKGQTAML